MPNPSTGTTRIGYALASSHQEAYLEIRDNMSGQIKKRLGLDVHQQYVDVALAGFTPGVYHYTLVGAGMPLAHKRMVVLQP